MNVRFLVLFFAICGFLTACSGISKTDCLTTNWEQVGLNDGQNGVQASSAESLQESCSSASAKVDMDAYKRGHEKGVALFCQAENAFDIGASGNVYSVACPQEFKDEYDIGYKFYVVNNNIKQIETAINTSSADINKLQSGISSAYLQLNNSDLSPSEENQIRQNINSMEGQIEGAENAIVRLEPMLSQSKKNLSDLKSYYGK